MYVLVSVLVSECVGVLFQIDTFEDGIIRYILRKQYIHDQIFALERDKSLIEKQALSLFILSQYTAE